MQNESFQESKISMIQGETHKINQFQYE